LRVAGARASFTLLDSQRDSRATSLNRKPTGAFFFMSLGSSGWYLTSGAGVRVISGPRCDASASAAVRVPATIDRVETKSVSTIFPRVVG
jgi:hypothetical protein